MNAPAPLRGELPDTVKKAAKTISPLLWGQPYSDLRGPLHYAGAPHVHAAILRRKARLWEKQAHAARVCADYLDPQDAV